MAAATSTAKVYSASKRRPSNQSIMSSRNQQNTRQVQVKIINVNRLGWAEGIIIEPSPLKGERVSIKVRDGKPSTGQSCTCKVIPNKNSRHSKWFAVYCRENVKSLVSWEPWQVGAEAVVLNLPSTRPGSDHRGIRFACWKCGRNIIESSQVFKIKKLSVWTNCLWAASIGVVVDQKLDWNDVKKCKVQKVRCTCKHMLGSYYSKRYADADELQQFPCFKFTTAWERKKWNGDIPLLALVLTGNNREDVEQRIEELEPSDDWSIDKQFMCGGGRVDKSTYELMEKAKKLQLEKEQLEERARVAEMAATAPMANTTDVDHHQVEMLANKEREIEERERQVREAESAAATKARKEVEELERRALEAEALAATKSALASESAKRAKEVEEQLAEAKARGIKSLPKRVIWECNVDGSWTPYSAKVNDLLEDCHVKGVKVQFSLSPHQYEVEFSAVNQQSQMYQRNTSTNVRRPIRRREEQDDSFSATSDFVIWECQTDNEWTPYPPDIAQDLEHCYEQKSKASFVLSNDNAYEIDFQSSSNTNLMQRNVETNVERQVRRRIAKNVTTNLPRSWSKQSPGQNCELVSLSEDSPVWRGVESKLKETLPSAKLKRLQRVQNISLWEYYCFREEQAKKLSGGGSSAANAIHVWHGTRDNDPKTIYMDKKDGFMMQHSRAGMWGRGIYFASRASYSDNFAHQHDEEGELTTTSSTTRGFFGTLFSTTTTKTYRTLILARLVVGEEIHLPSDETLRLPPKKPQGNDRYDTVTGTTKGTKVYIVYENGRAYPEYLVTYS